MFKLSLEVIDYQIKDTFPEELNQIVEKIYEGLDSRKFKTNTDVIASPLSKDIEKLIFTRFGLNVVMDPKLHLYYPAAIIPFSSDYLLKASSPNGVSGNTSYIDLIFGANKGIINHINKINIERNKGLSKINNKKGWINTKHARVGGYLSEVRHYLIVNFQTLKGLGLSTRETVAVVIHELGHAFTGLETHHKFTTSNAAIGSILDDINGGKSDKVYYKYKRYFGEQDLIDASISQDSEVTDFYGPLASRYIKCLSSQVINNKYDETKFEYLADNFSTRFGLGKDIVSGLHLIHLKYDNTIQTSYTAFYSMHLVEIMGVAAVLALGGPIGFILMGLIFLFSGKENANLTYDLPVDRYNRVRNAIVDNLKDPELPKDYTENLINQFEHIDAIMNSVIARTTIMEILANNIKPGSREAVYYIGIQQQAENALNNTLFVKTAKLRNV